MMRGRGFRRGSGGAAALALLLCGGGGHGLPAQALGYRGAWEAPEQIAAWRFLPAPADGAAAASPDRLLWFDDDGVGRLVELDAGEADASGAEGPSGFEARVRATFRLPDPATSLLALGEADGEPGTRELFVADGRGLWTVAVDVEGGELELELLGRGAVHDFRVFRPKFAPGLVRDVDGRAGDEFLLPKRDRLELWGRSEDGSFARFETLPIEVSIALDATANGVSDDLGSEIQVPGIELQDVDGDGRPDLVFREGQVRRFALQGEGRRFGERTVEIDLARFQDRSPRSSVGLGETVALGDDQVIEWRDLNGDSVPDHVISHRRRIWVFHANPPGAPDAGPQFRRPVQNLRVAETASRIGLLRVDEDERPDLVVFKVALPSATELAIGLVSSIDIQVTLLGYVCASDGRFERTPARRRELTIRIPSLLGLLEQAAELAERFVDVVRKFRWSVFADVNGDGRGDLVLLTEEEDALEVWFGRVPVDPQGRAVAPDLGRGIEEFLRELLFEDEDTVFTIERMLKVMAALFDQRSAALAGDAPPDAVVPVPAHLRVRDLVGADLDGDGGEEIVLVHADDEAPRLFRMMVFGTVR